MGLGQPSPRLSARHRGHSRAGALWRFLSIRSSVRSPLPGAHELEADAGRDHYFHEPRAAASAVELEPPLEVLGEAQVVPGVLVGALEVEQVLGRQAAYADLTPDVGADGQKRRLGRHNRRVRWSGVGSR